MIKAEIIALKKFTGSPVRGSDCVNWTYQLRPQYWRFSFYSLHHFLNRMRSLSDGCQEEWALVFSENNFRIERNTLEQFLSSEHSNQHLLCSIFKMIVPIGYADLSLILYETYWPFLFLFCHCQLEDRVQSPFMWNYLGCLTLKRQEGDKKETEALT